VSTLARWSLGSGSVRDSNAMVIRWWAACKADEYDVVILLEKVVAILGQSPLKRRRKRRQLLLNFEEVLIPKIVFVSNARGQDHVGNVVSADLTPHRMRQLKSTLGSLLVS